MTGAKAMIMQNSRSSGGKDCTYVGSGGLRAASNDPVGVVMQI